LNALQNEYKSIAKNDHIPFSIAFAYKGYRNEKYFSYCLPEFVVILILFLFPLISVKPISADHAAPIGINN
jgi:hypothetical protein